MTRDPGVARKVVISTKFGFTISDQGEGLARMVGVDSRPGHLKAVAEASLKRLGIETIDLFYQHRVDPKVPIRTIQSSAPGIPKPDWRW